MNTRARKCIAAAAAALASLAIAAGPAAATGSSPSPSPATGKKITVPANNVTFALATSNGKTNDGRQVFRYTAKPGETIRDHVIVYNLGRVKGTFAVYAVDAQTSQDGAFTLTTITDKQTGFGSWTRAGKNFLILPGGTSVVVPITITVPKNANPGDIVGGVVVSDVPQRPSITSVQQSLAVATRIGIRTIVRVDGKYRASVKVSGLTTSFTPSLTHAGYGSYTMSWDVENDGNVRVAADRTVDVSALLGGTVLHEERPRLDQILPGDRIHESISIDNVVAGIRLTGSVDAAAVVLEGEVTPEADGVSSNTDWAISWIAVGIVSLTAALLILLVVRLRHRRRSSGSAGGSGGGRHGGNGGGAPTSPAPDLVSSEVSR